jgi:hypothetical protein
MYTSNPIAVPYNVISFSTIPKHDFTEFVDIAVAKLKGKVPLTVPNDPELIIVKKPLWKFGFEGFTVGDVRPFTY